jgi:hypothetical protein
MINKKTIFATMTGIALGGVALIISLLFSAFKYDASAKTALDDSIMVSYFTVENKEELLETTLTLFGFATTDNHLTNDNDNLLSLSEDITVRIVAQAEIGDVQNTILEVISANETSRLRVHEGSVVNGLFIKSITDKHLVVKKDTVEHIIKLFHPKELKSTHTEQTNDTP